VGGASLIGNAEQKPSPTLPSSGNPTSTKKPEIVNWLEHKRMLPYVLPGARIEGFGLDLKTGATEGPIDFNGTVSDMFKQLKEMRRGHESRSIVFIGHGYGSVLIAKMMSEAAYETERNATLGKSIAAIALFAAPLKNPTELTKWTADTFGISQDSKLFTSAAPNGLLLHAEQWRELVQDNIKKTIATFVVLERNAIPPPSSDSNDTEDQEHVDIRHLLKENPNHLWETELTTGDVAKFSGPGDPRFQPISRCISDAVHTHQLLAAAEDGNEDMIKHLISHSIDLNLSNTDGRTALHIAADNDKLNIVGLLLEAASPNLKDRKDNLGDTALHIAVRGKKNSSPSIVKKLLAKGANSNLENNNGETPKGLSQEKGMLPQTKRWFEKPPLVRGTPIRDHLHKGKPPEGYAAIACELVGMTAREIYAAKGQTPDAYLPINNTVSELIYSGKDVNSTFKSLRGSGSKGKAVCRWYHVPMNNVSSLDSIIIP